nr:redoxin domain-containing protein [Chloroflexota bacterium]
MQIAWRLLIIGPVLILVLAGCGGAATPTPLASNPPVAPREGARAPDFTLRELGGAEVRLSDLRGKLVLLNFWATW